jgi:hypothetical protein
MTDTLLDIITREIEELLEPVALAVDDPHWLDCLLTSLGINTSDVPSGPLIDGLRAAVNLKQQITELAATPSPSFDDIARVLGAAGDLFTSVRAIESDNGVGPAFQDIGAELVQSLITRHLASAHPLLFQLAVMATVIEPAGDAEPTTAVVVGEDELRLPMEIDRIHPKRLVDLLRDPVAVLKTQYVNGLATVDDANAMADRLFPRVAAVLKQLGVPCIYGLHDRNRPVLGDAALFVDHALTVFLAEKASGAPGDIGFTLALSSADRGDLGLVVTPFGALALTLEAGQWSFKIDFTADVDALAYGRRGLTLVARPGATEVDGSFAAILGASDSGPAFVLGSPSGTRLEAGGAQIKVATALSEAKQTLAISGDVSKSAIVIARGDGDGFISSILPSDGVRAEFDLGLAWSNTDGLSLRGGAGLDATLPINRSIGGIVTLSSAHVTLLVQDGRLAAETSLTGSLAIGPVKAVVDRIGLSTVLSFPPSGGNLGVADLDFGFKPPTGIGLSLNTQGVVSGGGFLFHDPVQSLYAGVMQLSISDAFTVTAFGLIATKMPDGSPGYSLIVFITAEDFRPIPLGMGFTLQGIGGMVAVNRTFDQDVLRAGMQNDTLKALLFPRDPVTNAPTIIRSLASAFPAKRGSYLLGILARIGWFTPTLIQLDLALILEFGARKRLLVLGRINALLPSPDNDLVRINLDAIGVLDFDQDTASIDAMLVDSRLAKKFVLTGAAALRAGWGSGPHQGFVLAVGGFNPHFAPPAGVPPLYRVAIALSSGHNPRLTCEAYFAITANTIQFGANAALYAEAYSFSISGDIGFDVLITRAPLHFIADYHASVQLKYGSHNLFKVAVDGSLEGPRPLRVSGKATFEIFWCDFSVRFDKTLIDGEPPPPPPAVDVLAELNRALATAQSWSTQAPPNASHGVALRRLAPGTALVLDPLGRLAIRQDVVPLNTGRDIDVFGGAPVAGARRFTLAAALNNVDLKDVTALQAPFAPAQFFAMSDDDKIASPSFQQMDAGFVVGTDDAVTIDANELVPARLDYDSIVIDTLTGAVPQPQPKPYALPPGQLTVHAATGAAARAPVRSVGRARFRTPGKPAVDLAAPAWAIAPLDGGPPQAVAAAVKAWSEYQGALTTLNRAGAAARFQLVPAAALAA